MLISLCESWFVCYIYPLFFDSTMHITIVLISVPAQSNVTEMLISSKCSGKYYDLKSSLQKDHWYLVYVTVFEDITVGHRFRSFNGRPFTKEPGSRT